MNIAPISLINFSGLKKHIVPKTQALKNNQNPPEDTVVFSYNSSENTRDYNAELEDYIKNTNLGRELKNNRELRTTTRFLMEEADLLPQDAHNAALLIIETKKDKSNAKPGDTQDYDRAYNGSMDFLTYYGLSERKAGEILSYLL